MKQHEVENDRARFYQLRTAVYNKLYEWNPKSDPNMHPYHLAALLGRAEHFTPLSFLTEAEVTACKNLLGEHGYSYYKMLLAQRGINDL